MVRGRSLSAIPSSMKGVQVGYIELRGVTKRFRKVVAVDNLDLKVEKGEFHTLLGPSGCGKTTTLRMIAGLEEPDEGEIYIGDKCVFSMERGIFVPPPHRSVDLIFQSYALWPHMTVFHNVAFGLSDKSLHKQKVDQVVGDILKKFDMDGYESRYPSELSGGQQQRVAVARMVVTQPAVFLMDEPLSNLDAKLRMRLRSELKRLHQEAQATTVYVTHDQVEAMTLSNRITVMKDGLLQQTASPTHLYHYSANLFVADFMGNPQINRLDGIVDTVDGQRCFVSKDARFQVPLPGAKVDLRHGKRVVLVTHPECLDISTDKVPSSTQMSVYSVLMAGSETLIYLQSENLVLVSKKEGQVKVKTDQEAWVSFASFNLYDSETQELLCSGGKETVGGGKDFNTQRRHSRIGAVFFDAGGILYYRKLSTIEAFIKACGRNAVDLGSPTELRERWKPLKAVSQKGELTFEEALRDLARFIAVEVTRNNIIEQVLQSHEKVLPVPKVREVLQYLKDNNIKVGVITDSSVDSSKKMEFFRKIDIDSLIDTVANSYDLGFRKPGPEIYKTAMEELNVSPSESLFVGHALDELRGAKALGMITVACRRDPDVGEADADYIVSELADLLALVEKLMAKT
jgi:multiple sugar transport system ATP-binding protein